MTRAGLICAVALAQHVAAADTAALTFVEQSGCVIGPDTVVDAVEAGIAPSEIEAFIAGLSDGNTREVDGWRVLSDDICRIQMPQIPPVLQHDDPEVQAAWSEPDAHAEFDAFGCYLHVNALEAGLESSRGWTQAKAFDAYLEYVAAGVISGEIRYYSNNPLLTPFGPRLMIGECAVGDDIEEINANHPVLTAIFATYVRRAAEYYDCDYGNNLLEVSALGEVPWLQESGNTNVLLGLEVHLIALGAGWIEWDRSDIEDRGTLRPPLCRG